MKSAWEKAFENSCAFNSKREKSYTIHCKTLLTIYITKKWKFIHTIFRDTFVSGFSIKTVWSYFFCRFLLIEMQRENRNILNDFFRLRATKSFVNSFLKVWIERLWKDIMVSININRGTLYHRQKCGNFRFEMIILLWSIQFQNPSGTEGEGKKVHICNLIQELNKERTHLQNCLARFKINCIRVKYWSNSSVIYKAMKAKGLW